MLNTYEELMVARIVGRATRRIIYRTAICTMVAVFAGQTLAVFFLAWIDS